ncbi:MAG: hypothetical protein VB035_01410 [Candidatus Fimivivens sp.]|nr:hypothetical protein [Candidatus Fimivivens sp.]
MKKVIVIFVLIFVAGIMAGGAFEWFSSLDAENTTENYSDVVTKTELPASSSESIDKVETAEQAPTASDQHRVTNPDKICSTPGCGRAVFVTYKGRELCVRCYGEAKNRDAGLN